VAPAASGGGLGATAVKGLPFTGAWVIDCLAVGFLLLAAGLMLVRRARLWARDEGSQAATVCEVPAEAVSFAASSSA
jgi:hypothetical protein